MLLLDAPPTARYGGPVPPTEIPPIRGKLLSALRAVAANPGGLRVEACPSTMPLLVEMGLVRLRARGEPAWVLTRLGQRTVATYGRDEP